jgi:hypothetical protein
MAKRLEASVSRDALVENRPPSPQLLWVGAGLGAVGWLGGVGGGLGLPPLREFCFPALSFSSPAKKYAPYRALVPPPRTPAAALGDSARPRPTRRALRRLTTGGAPRQYPEYHKLCLRCPSGCHH